MACAPNSGVGVQHRFTNLEIPGCGPPPGPPTDPNERFILDLSNAIDRNFMDYSITPLERSCAAVQVISIVGGPPVVGAVFYAGQVWFCI